MLYTTTSSGLDTPTHKNTNQVLPTVVARVVAAMPPRPRLVGGPQVLVLPMIPVVAVVVATLLTGAQTTTDISNCKAWVSAANVLQQNERTILSNDKTNRNLQCYKAYS